MAATPSAAWAADGRTSRVVDEETGKHHRDIGADSTAAEYLDSMDRRFQILENHVTFLYDEIQEN